MYKEYAPLEKAFADKQIHPADLKDAVTAAINKVGSISYFFACVFLSVICCRPSFSRPSASASRAPSWSSSHRTLILLLLPRCVD